MAERVISIDEVPGSIPGFSIFLHLFPFFFRLAEILCVARGTTKSGRGRSALPAARGAARATRRSPLPSPRPWPPSPSSRAPPPLAPSSRAPQPRAADLLLLLCRRCRCRRRRRCCCCARSLARQIGFCAPHPRPAREQKKKEIEIRMYFDDSLY